MIKDKKERKEKLLQGVFYYYNDTLLIHSKVKNICELTSCLYIDFEVGAVDVTF